MQNPIPKQVLLTLVCIVSTKLVYIYRLTTFLLRVYSEKDWARPARKNSAVCPFTNTLFDQLDRFILFWTQWTGTRLIKKKRTMYRLFNLILCPIKTLQNPYCHYMWYVFVQSKLFKTCIVTTTLLILRIFARTRCTTSPVAKNRKVINKKAK